MAIGTGLGLALGGTLAAGGTIAAGAMGADAAGDAASMQAAAANRATDLQGKIFNQTRADAMPWRSAGLAGLAGLIDIPENFIGPEQMRKVGEDAFNKVLSEDKYIVNVPGGFGNDIDAVIDYYKQQGKADSIDYYQNLKARASAARDKALDELNQQNSQAILEGGGLKSDFTRDFTMADFVKDPGYDFRMQEGQKALERSAAARGGLQSGGTMKALARYGQDFASNEYQNAYNRFNADRDRRFNRLVGIAGVGQTANSQIGSAGMNYANQAGANIIGAGNAAGAARLAGANAWGNTLSSLGQIPMDLASLNSMNSWMNRSRAGVNSNSIASLDMNSIRPQWGSGL